MDSPEARKSARGLGVTPHQRNKKQVSADHDGDTDRNLQTCQPQVTCMRRSQDAKQEGCESQQR
jgi:hypothetical protein